MQVNNPKRKPKLKMSSTKATFLSVKDRPLMRGLSKRLQNKFDKDDPFRHLFFNDQENTAKKVTKQESFKR